jgi:hypothetical protein
MPTFQRRALIQPITLYKDRTMSDQKLGLFAEITRDLLMRAFLREYRLAEKHERERHPVPTWSDFAALSSRQFCKRHYSIEITDEHDRRSAGQAFVSLLNLSSVRGGHIPEEESSPYVRKALLMFTARLLLGCNFDPEKLC